MKDLTGQKFGRLRVIGPSTGRSSSGGMVWDCVCDCGAENSVRATNLMTGNTQSCGCLASEVTSRVAKLKRGVPLPAAATHGKSKTRTYRIWSGAKTRCFNPKSGDAGNYGSRGITMCAEWASSFDRFLKDMGEAPHGLTLERKDVNGNYEPGNCVWATVEQQGQNTRHTKLSLEKAHEIRTRRASGEPTAHIAQEYGVSKATVQQVVAERIWRSKA